MRFQPMVGVQAPLQTLAMGWGLAVVQPSLVVGLVECRVVQPSLVGSRVERWARLASAWWDMLEPQKASAHSLAKDTYIDRPDNALVEEVRRCLCRMPELSLDMPGLCGHPPAAGQQVRERWACESLSLAICCVCSGVSS